MAVLVLADHDNKTLRDTTAKAVNAASQLSDAVDILVTGENAGSLADAAAKIAGVRKVLLAESPALRHALAEAMAGLIAPLMANYDVFVTPATFTGKDVAPRIAALLDVAPITDVVKITGADTFVRPIYAGNALETVQSSDKKRILTVRATAFDASPQGGHAAVETVTPAADPATRFVSEQIVASSRPELGAAKIIVSGGRALGSAEEFKTAIGGLADKLGAAVGASRAAVDAGYAPNDVQVGQTGKIVAPQLYIAVGISGAIQHLAGMKDSKIIVAINKDAEAPIFAVADYGWVADYKTALPELMAALDSK